MIFNHPYYKQLVELERYIRANLAGELSVEMLARRMHLSAFHFHRVFKSLVRESVHEYVTRVRLEVAAMRLKFTEDKIQDIAFEVGYQNTETFIRAFNRNYHSTPRAFRKAQQQIVENRLEEIVRKKVAEQMVSTELIRLDPILVAFLTHKGPYPTVGETWGQLMQSIPPLECGRLIGVPYSDPHTAAPDQIRYDACVEIRPTYTPQEHIQVKELVGGQFVQTIHLGALEKIDDTYHLLYGLWLPNSRFELRNEPSMEIYLTDSRKTAPTEARTAIYLPIKTFK